MADTYGAETIPLTSPQVRPLVFAEGDALLGWVADFLKTILNTYADTVWQTVAPGKHVVENVFLHNPEKNGINEARLPALYVWREDDDTNKVEWLAEDYRAMDGVLHVRWVPQVATDDKRAIRVPIVNALKKIVDKAIESGRDPAWIVSGDTDPQAAADGSQLLSYAQASIIELTSGKFRELTIDLKPEGQKKYPALFLDFMTQELLVEDLTSFSPNVKIDVTFVAPPDADNPEPFVLGEEIYD